MWRTGGELLHVVCGEFAAGEIFFEVVSAFATLGISTGITPFLSVTGKLFIIATMIIGRIGSLTVMLALRRKPETQEYQYPEERVML